jgi:hypothetical protein
MASFCVEKFGPTRMKELTPQDIEARVGDFMELMDVNVELSLSVNI